MQSFRYRQHVAAQSFLSNIPLSGSCSDGQKRNFRLNNEKFASLDDYGKEERNNGQTEVVQVSPHNTSHSAQSPGKVFGRSGAAARRASLAVPSCGPKNVSFNEFGYGQKTLTDKAEDSARPLSLALKPITRQRFVLGSPLRSNSATQATSNDLDSTCHDYYPRRYAVSTKNLQSNPLLMASVIPHSRESVDHLGSRGSSTVPTGGKSRIHSDTPLFNNIFCRQSRSSTGPGQTSCAPKPAPPDADSMLASMPVFTKPLTLLKPVAAEERSYAHLLVPRFPVGYARPAQAAGADEPKSELTRSSTYVPKPTSLAARRYQCGRSQTVSLHGISTSTSSLNSDTLYRRSRGSPDPIGETGGTAGSGHKPLGGFPTWRVTSPDTPSMDSLEQRCIILYEDPLVHYDPCLLDDPLMPQLTNRRVFSFLGYVTSVLGYRRPDEHKRSINREFHLRFPAIQLSLTKMRSLKLAMLSVALKTHLDLWIVAHAHVLFEKMILKLFVCKTNRKLCAGAAMLISAKLNDVKRADILRLIQELVTELRVDRRELLNLELAAFIGLEFTVISTDAETMPHLKQLQKVLGLMSAVVKPPRRGSEALPSVQFLHSDHSLSAVNISSALGSSCRRVVVDSAGGGGATTSLARNSTS